MSRATAIGELKLAIFNAHGIPIDEQRMIFKGKRGADGEKVGDFGVVSGSDLVLFRRSVGSV